MGDDPAADETAASARVISYTSLDNSSVAERSAEDEAKATSDALTNGLLACLLRPCVNRLDSSLQLTRLSQLELKMKLDSLAAEFKCLSTVQHEHLLPVASFHSCVSADKSISSTSSDATKTDTTDTHTLLDRYVHRLYDARARITVVGKILEATQKRLETLSQRFERKKNIKCSVLEPQRTSITCVATEGTLLNDNLIDEEYLAEEVNYNNKQQQKVQDLCSDKEEKEEKSVKYVAEIAKLMTETELSKSLC